LETGHHHGIVKQIANKKSVEVISVGDSSVELVTKTEEDSVELVRKDSKLVAESATSENSSAFSIEYITQEQQDNILRWQEGVGGEDSGVSENEDATVLYSDSDSDDVALSLVSAVSSHEV
jgi:hypothetical protein